jgi:prolycopene isomerase
MTRRKFIELMSLLTATSLLSWRCAPRPPARGPGRGYDAVIIGAGLGGLACAALMAQNGFRPLVVEQHDIPGGYATSFQRFGSEGSAFQCEVSLHSISAKAPGTRKLLTDMGVYDRLQFADHKLAWSSLGPEGFLDLPAAGLAGFERILAQRFPGERSGIAGFMAYWQKLLDELDAFERQGMPALRALFPVQYPTLWDVAGKSLGQILDRFLADRGLKDLAGLTWGYYGLPPSKLSAFYYLVPMGQYLTFGGQYIRGTSQALSDALAKVIAERGGEVLLGERVSGILLADGRAVGVRTESGRSLAARAVVSNAAVPATLALLPAGALPEDYRRRVAGLRPSLSSVIVWLGLDRDVTALQPRAEISIEAGDPEAAYAAALAGDYEGGGVGLMLYDNLLPGFSPKGRSTVSLLALAGFEPWRRFAADYEAGRKEAYEREKARVADVLIAKAERAALPDLSKMIVMREAATPLTNRRFTGNTDGAIYGFDQTPDNSFMHRLKSRTPLKGLYLASAWGEPGAGYAGALLAGKQAFKNLVEDLR